MKPFENEEWNTFVEKGIVSEKRLNFIANKIKTNLPLSIKEQAVYIDKTNSINTKLQNLLR